MNSVIGFFILRLVDGDKTGGHFDQRDEYGDIGATFLGVAMEGTVIPWLDHGVNAL